MGHRANLIIASQDAYALYFSHWCANTITTDLFWGPAHALNFIQIQRKMSPETGWLDDVRSEGGAAVDLDKKTLLLYGGEDLLYDIPLRRVYLKLMSLVWKDWSINWAYEGVLDLAATVGYPLHKVCSKKDTSKRLICENVLTPPEQKSWLNCVGSIRFDQNKILIYPLGGNIYDYLSCGPQILDFIDDTYGYEQVTLSDWSPYFPSGGFHIDVPQKRIDFWSARETSMIEESLSERWVNWKINWNKDNYEQHIQDTKGNIIFQETSLEQLLNQLKTILLYDFDVQVELVLNFIRDEIGNGKDEIINEMALSHVKLDLEKEMREEILSRVMEEFSTMVQTF